MNLPRIELDLGKISHNAKALLALYSTKCIDIIGVTKVVCGDPIVADVLVDAGIRALADSRIQNIARMRQAGIKAQFVLLRTPALSEAELAVKYADISLNSEISIIKRLSAYAVESKTIHEVILMVELGDLREGLMPEDLDQTIGQLVNLEGVTLAGVGTNLACFGGIKPDDRKLDQLSALAAGIEDRYKIELRYISGGNSANYDWFVSAEDVGRVNNLRLGESIYLGCETLHRRSIPGLYTDAFKLFAEVIESKEKPSKPYGDVCEDAFGNVNEFQDRGLMRRAILGIGLQDVLVAGLVPDLDIEVLGASSDHLIVDCKATDLKVGDEVGFGLNYGALLSAMTSPYVTKTYAQ